MLPFGHARTVGNRRVPADAGAAGDALPPAGGHEPRRRHRAVRRRPRRGGRRRRAAGGVAAGRRPPPDHAHAVPLGRRRRAGPGGRRPRRRAARRARPAPPRPPPSRTPSSTSSWSPTASRGFELDAAPLWRLTLFRLGPAHEPLRVHVPPLAARHERRVGDRGGVPHLRRAASRRGRRARRAAAVQGPHRVVARRTWMPIAPAAQAYYADVARRVRRADPADVAGRRDRRRRRRGRRSTCTARCGSASPTTSAPASTRFTADRRVNGAGARRGRVGAWCWPPSPARPTSCSARRAAAGAPVCPAART